VPLDEPPDAPLDELLDEPFPMLGQWEEPLDGGLAEDPADDGAVAGASPDAAAGADVEPVEPDVVPDVVEVELPVAAEATAVPPPTRMPASPIPASVCRSLIFIRNHLLLFGCPCLSVPLLSGAAGPGGDGIPTIGNTLQTGLRG
jgi:hypothetical protein